MQGEQHEVSEGRCQAGTFGACGSPRALTSDAVSTLQFSRPSAVLTLIFLSGCPYASSVVLLVASTFVTGLFARFFEKYLLLNHPILIFLFFVTQLSRLLYWRRTSSVACLQALEEAEHKLGARLRLASFPLRSFSKKSDRRVRRTQTDEIAMQC